MIDLDYLHTLQLNLALEVKRICEEEGIRYFLVDGTALGAVNLHGFLPWDDDLDIGMYWPDYQRFLRACGDKLSPRYKMKDFTTDPNFGCSFGQLIDTKVELIQENNESASDVKGVFIDIHPFSNCSDSVVVRKLEYYRFKFYKLCLLQRREYISGKTKTVALLKIANKFMSDSMIEKRILKMRNHKQGKLALKIHGRHPEDFIVIDNLDKLRKIAFAEREFPIQPDAQRMLDAVYGAFDINKYEENRHGIIALNSRGGGTA